MHTWMFPLFATVIILAFIVVGIWAWKSTSNRKKNKSANEFKDRKEEDEI